MSVHPLPVTFPKPVPVYFRVPVPVHSIDGPDFVARVSLCVAILALIIAVVTFIAVLRQIRLATDQLGKANKQIKLARKQIKLAEDELRLVGDDLDLSRQQNAELNRRPFLYLSFGINRETTFESQTRVNLAGRSMNLSGTNVQVTAVRDIPLVIRNSGERLTARYLAEIFVPASWFPVNPNATYYNEWREILGNWYYVFRWSSVDPLYPIDVPRTLDWELPFFKSQPQTICLWRIYDEYGTYPSEGYGSLRV